MAALPSKASLLVERQVRKLLDLSPAFQRLQQDRQSQMISGLVHLGGYLVEPEGIPANQLAGAILFVPAQTGPGAFQDLVNAVNFPDFVANLIQGVYQAIVDSSIKQMEAYADLVKKASETVDQFAKDTVTNSSSRDYLAATYPDMFDQDPKSGRLRLREDADRVLAIQRLKLLPLDCPLRSLSPDQIEKKLVPAARRRMAAKRQQLLATMVLMG